MVSTEDLKKIWLTASLEDPLLEKIMPLTQLRIFGEKAVLFQEGQEAHTLYMLLTGKVVLELRASETLKISLEAMKPGDPFGWSAIMPGSSYGASATCTEPCEVITIPGAELKKMMDEDVLLGYRMMQGCAEALKTRLLTRTDQFLKTFQQLPDIIDVCKLE
jgi:CRP-like cAMP-binding protein